MKIKRFMLGLAAVGLTSLALGALAQEHGNDACKDAADKADCMHAQMDRHIQEHEARLHDALKLTATQEPAWKTLTDSIHQQMAAEEAERKTRPAHSDTEKLSAPQKLEEHLAMMQKHLSAMQTRLAALKSFYAVLSPEQQATMNSALAKMERHRFQSRDWHHHD